MSNVKKETQNTQPATMPRFPGGGGGGPHMAAMSVMSKPKNFKESLFRLLRYFKPHAFMFTMVVLINIVATVCNSLGPRILGYATNEISRGTIAVLKGTGIPIDMGVLAKILTTLAFIYVFSAILRYIDNYILSGITQRTMYDLRRSVDERLRKLPLEYYDKNAHGDILSRVTNDVDTISNTVQQSLNQAITSVISLITVFTIMLSISPLLTLIGAVTLPLGIISASFIIKFSQKFFKGQQKSLGRLNGYIEEMYTGHNVIKAFGREERSVKDFDAINQTLYSYAWKAQFASGVMMPIISFMTDLGYVAVAVVGATMVIKGQVLIGDIQAFVQYLRQFSHPIATLASTANTIQSAVAAAERIFELLDENEQSPESKAPVVPDKVSGHVQFDHVRFGYTEDNILIKDLNADFKSGNMIAIVGPTGAGKTTIVNLLLRFYDIQGGEMRIDSVSIMDMTREELRSHFGMVLQDTWLFMGSIKENIRYGRLEASDEEVVSAAKAAYADHFIRQLPGGYDFELNEDASNISQGQRQLLTIARAILSDPDILILDEATSSVDTRTEHIIQKAMEGLMKGRTSFVIAHRLSTIKDADRILVLRDGDIVETGTHEELLSKNGFYSELYNSQFKQQTA